ncbi:AAA family ATPase [Nocardia sp. CDC159]|uniref:AAA family ATPase n=1 Tax=Nocardia pulmonis TaxID=2951408 RepID=A0A9X2EC49_9NOCA|nr:MULTISPECIES: AAA family ATPase [Nocardia]MCM6777605.1 AAA family ATPase [Nocardia pulmonis]MCM6790591.1 AAA family ATPase [Nocardia sp. CDC159]
MTVFLSLRSRRRRPRDAASSHSVTSGRCDGRDPVRPCRPHPRRSPGSRYGGIRYGHHRTATLGARGVGLIGRGRAAGWLREVLGRTVSSHGGVVLVCGEAGIGKTALVGEVVGEVGERALVLAATAWNGEGAPGFWPWVQVLRGLRRAAGPGRWASLDRVAGSALSMLIGETPVGADGSTLFRVGDAITEALVAACAVRPVIVVIDDLHRADVASVHLLSFVARHTWFERLAVVAAVRDDEIAEPGHPLREAFEELRSAARSLELSALSAAEIGELAAAATGRPISADEAATLHALTGGNPFAAEQAARLWHADDALGTLNPGVRQILSARLALLPEPVVDLLTTAALLGNEFHGTVLDSVAAAIGQHRDSTSAALTMAIRARLVTAEFADRYRFVHDLIREALADRLGPDEARKRRAAIVSALVCSGAAAAEIAEHAYLAADALAADERLRLLLDAARDACGRLAAGEAARHYRRAAQLLDTDDDRSGEVLLALADALTDAGDLTEARGVFETVLDHATRFDRPELFARAALGLHELGMPDPEFDADREIALLDTAHQRLTATRPETDPLAVRLLAASLRARMHTGRTRAERNIDGDTVLRLARRSGDDAALVAGLLARHDAIWRPGTATDRLTVANELVALGNRLRRDEIRLQGMLLRSAALLELSDPRVHAELAALTLDADRSRLPRFRFVALSRSGALHLLTGRFAEARADIDGAYALGERLGEVDRVPLWLEQRWALAILADDPDGAAAFVDRYYTMAGEYTAVTDLVTAALRADIERVRLRLEDVRRLDRTYPLHFQAAILVALTHAALVLDDPELRDALRHRLAPLRPYWAVVAGGGAAYGPYAYWLGRLAAAAGDHRSATTELRAAAASARRLRALPWVAAAERELRLLAHGDLEPPDPDSNSPANIQAENIFRREGAVWTLRFADRTAHLPDAKGLRDLHLLLANPGYDIPSIELIGVPGDPTARAAESLGAEPMLDEQAKAAYRHRLATLDAEIDRATALGADERAVRLDRERAALLAELRRAAGLAGRTRTLGDEAERARKTVSARVRDTLRRLDREHPELAEHLRASVALGVVCGYHPHREVRWAL